MLPRIRGRQSVIWVCCLPHTVVPTLHFAISQRPMPLQPPEKETAFSYVPDMVLQGAHRTVNTVKKNLT